MDILESFQELVGNILNVNWLKYFCLDDMAKVSLHVIKRDIQVNVIVGYWVSDKWHRAPWAHNASQSG